MINIRLISDGSITSVPKDVIKQSRLIAGMLEDDDSTGPIEIPIDKQELTKDILDKLIKFCVYQSQPGNELITEIDKPIQSKDVTQVIKVKWYVDYITTKNDGTPISDNYYEYLNRLTISAHFLDIYALLEICCAYYACVIKGKTPEDVRKIFNIKEEPKNLKENETVKDNDVKMST